ncbi:hypothetical protein K438DRAFT_1845672 [Mycena galopus ATCC 62051]|nr:hypothetical protein K438DRAFT_1845672 [Mycena galopus ATCC 62051]
MARKLVLVAGATGTQGRALIRALNLDNTVEGSDVESDFHVLALTRTSSSPAQNVTVVEGNLAQ